MKKRVYWVDYVKVIACVLVVLGHFFQSMIKSGILPANDFYKWFDTTIYYFHVPLFFICSGFLYQKFSRVNSIETWRKNISRKIIALGIPYIIFSLATWILKNVFSGAVNEQSNGLLKTLFFHPLSPYWFLYCLFFLFLIIPTFENIKMAGLILVITIGAKLLICMCGGETVRKLG